MFCSYVLNSSSNGLNHPPKYLILEANHRIPFSHDFTRVIDPSYLKIRQNRIYRKGCIIGWVEYLFFDGLWSAAK